MNGKRYPDIYDTYWDFITDYERIVEKMLRCLLFRIKEIPAEKRQVLYAKTIELMGTFGRFVTYKEWLDLFEKEIASVKSSFFYILQPGVEKY